MQEMWVQSLSQEDPLEKEIETHYSILAWEIPWTVEPGDDFETKQQQTYDRFPFPSYLHLSIFHFV